MNAPRVWLALSVLCQLWIGPSTLDAQTATLRAGYALAGRPGALRPHSFPVLRIGKAPFRDNLDQPGFIGGLVTKYGQNPDSLPGKLAKDGALHDRASTRLYASCDRRTLRLVVECLEPELDQVKTGFDDYYSDDRVELLLDLNHDHHGFTRIAVLPNGEKRIDSYTVFENHLAWDRGYRKTDAALPVKLSTRIADGKWVLQADIDLDSTGALQRPWTVLGLNVVRYRSVHGEEFTMWCPDFERESAPLYFGDLYLGDPPLTVGEVTLGAVCWGENQGILAASGKSAARSVTASTFNHLGLYKKASFPVEQGKCSFAYEMDPRELMHSALALEIDGVPWGRYEFGWKRGLLLTHRPTDTFRAALPVPGEENFTWKTARYLLDRLPRLERSPDGFSLIGRELRIDLRRPDSYQALANLVMRRFHTDEHRLAAATLLLCQEGVLVSSGTGARLVSKLGSLAILQTGAAFCDTYGEALREVVIRMKNSSGQPFRAMVVNFKDPPQKTFDWPHHWLAGVAYRGGITLLDSELGTFFYNSDCTGLATLRELLENPALADRTAYGLSDYYRGLSLPEFMEREDGYMPGLR